MQVRRWRLSGQSIVFTNGVFDLLHTGHLSSLAEAAAQGRRLIVGMNSDASVKRLKGAGRPIYNEAARAAMLANLLLTDAVVIFDEDTPRDLILSIMPDVLVKGGDYTVEQIAGAAEVIENGGRIHLANMVEGISTTQLIQRLQQGE